MMYKPECEERLFNVKIPKCKVEEESAHIEISPSRGQGVGSHRCSSCSPIFFPFSGSVPFIHLPFLDIGLLLLQQPRDRCRISRNAHTFILFLVKRITRLFVTFTSTFAVCYLLLLMYKCVILSRNTN